MISKPLNIPLAAEEGHIPESSSPKEQRNRFLIKRKPEVNNLS